MLFNQPITNDRFDLESSKFIIEPQQELLRLFCNFAMKPDLVNQAGRRIPRRRISQYTEAARQLGLGRSTVCREMRRLGVSRTS